MNKVFYYLFIFPFVDISAIIRCRPFMTKNRKYVLWMEILYRKYVVMTTYIRCEMQKNGLTISAAYEFNEWLKIWRF